MKNLFLAIFSLCYLGSVGQTVASSCSAPDSIVRKYRIDANKLAIRRVYTTNSPLKDSVEIDKALSDYYLKALLAVYNATALPARDSVISMFNIHVYNPGVRELLVEADSNLAWMKKLHANNIPTGHATVDYLISKHYLQKIWYSTWVTPYATVVFRTDTNCNTEALAKKFKNISGVYTAGGDYYAGDGNNIEDSITANYTWLVYDRGWEDCSDGCSFHRYWQFRVYNDCSVEYGRSFGTPVTVGMSENRQIAGDIQVYPNPMDSEVNVDIEGSFKETRLILSNALGHPIITRDKAQPHETLDLHSVPRGIYYLKIETVGSYKVVKILKR